MKPLFPALAVLMLAAPALAQSAPPAAPDRAAFRAERHERMCTSRYAFAVGALAALEVQLKLTPAQKPAFEKWKSVKLASAKAHSDKCADFKPMDRDASIIEHRKQQITMLEARLADLKAETPALESFVKTLDKEQAETLKRAAHHVREARFGGAMGRGPMGGPMHGQGPMRGGMGGPGMPHAMMDGAPMGAGD